MAVDGVFIICIAIKNIALIFYKFDFMHPMNRQ
jgi:hypothetical protein